MAYTNIDDPSAYFQIALWTGDGTAGNAVTFDGNSDMQPDFVWSKRRDSATSNVLKNTSAGGTSDNDLHLVSDLTQAESTYAQYRMDFDSDGFTLDGVGDSGFQGIGTSMVSWSWKANGGTTSTDTTSSITSTVQVNSDAGFSVVTYTGDGTTTGGFGHGLGVAPKVVFVKRRNSAADWCVYHKDMGAAYFMKLNTTDAKASGVWQGLDPSSTTVVVYNGGLVNGNGDTYVAYCFAEKQGYSKFGSYIGNGSTNGPFVYTGFKPALIITKNADGTDSWNFLDNKRSPYNAADKYLQADNANAEGTYTFYDILSNGFKIRNTGNANISGNNILYMAFAENPFTTSTGIPTTAR